MISRLKLNRGRFTRVVSLLLAVLLIASTASIGIRYLRSSQAASPGTIYISPASGSWESGATFTATIREESGTQPVNSVQFFLNYNASQLQYLSTSEGDFNFQGLTDTATAGLIKVHRGMQDSTLTGDHAVISINFKVLSGSGTATLGIDQANSILASNGTNILQSVGNASYALTPAVIPDGSFSLLPASGNVAPGASVAVIVRLQSPSQKIFSGQAILSYPSGQLQYVSTVTSTAFPTESRTNSTAGTLDLIRATAPGGTGFIGDDTMVTVNFKVIGSSGSIPISIKAGSGIFDGNGNNILGNGSRTSNLTIVANSPPLTTTPPPPVTPATTASPTAPTVYRSGLSIATKSGRSAAVNGSSTQIQGSVQLAPVASPAILARSPGDSIVKVEYYLRKKLVATVDKSPYTYTIDTKKLSNGTYDMMVRTFYKSGAVESNTETLSVRNPVTFSYVMAHYGVNTFVVVLAVMVVALVAKRYLLPHFAQDTVPVEGYGGYTGVASKLSEVSRRAYEAPAPDVIVPSDRPVTEGVIAPEQTMAAQSTSALGVESPKPVVAAAPATPTIQTASVSPPAVPGTSISPTVQGGAPDDNSYRLPPTQGPIPGHV